MTREEELMNLVLVEELCIAKIGLHQNCRADATH